MNDLTGDEIRSRFLAFFEEKGHRVMSSSSLIPHGDPTLLLTTAGMVQFKPFFMGEARPPHPRLTSVQKCFRTTDIESVGDASHLTFFEMLGNFSVGDYFKAEAVALAWELITGRFSIPAGRLWVTVFFDDDEAEAIWRCTGVPAERIVRMGEADNFWGPAGETGPCGPCSEIYYDYGVEAGCGQPDCNPACKCGRFVEVWNLVFMQYYQDGEGRRTPLPKPNIDTGMGLERISAVLQGVRSVYDTDLFQPLLKLAAEISGKKYGANAEEDRSMRVVAEHGRAVTFLIADGVLPSNDGRGYVLRRLLRRGALFGRRLGMFKPFLVDIARSTIDLMAAAYPELNARRSFVLDVVRREEERFAETLSTGLEMLEQIMAGSVNAIPGELAFRLYDTYGFPVELTCEIAADRGITVDMDAFEREMTRQREMARSSQKFGLAGNAAADLRKEFEPTVFVGYDQLKRATRIAGILSGDERVQALTQGQPGALILESTPFYAEMGGQVGDTGHIYSADGIFVVTDCLRPDGHTTIHQGRLEGGRMAVGETVEAVVNNTRRKDIERNHTATHLLHLALRTVLGEHVQQRGSLVGPDGLRFDFSHLSPLSADELDRVQQAVNREIRADHGVADCQLPYKEAVAAGAVALFDEKYGDTVRVLTVGSPAVSKELCGGTHVNSSGEIGLFQITAESSIGAGLRRIEAVTGRVAEDNARAHARILQTLGKMLDAATGQLPERTQALLDEMDRVKRHADELELRLALNDIPRLLENARLVGTVRLLAARIKPSRPEILRGLADALREGIPSGVVVLGTVHEGKPFFLVSVTPDLVAAGYQAGKIIQQIAAVTGGGGGGKPALAQGGGKDVSKLDEALSAAADILAKK